MAETGSNKKVANSLVALSSAAVLAVYSAGYQRTKAAADRFEQQAASRRHAVPMAGQGAFVPPPVAPASEAAPVPGSPAAAAGRADGAAAAATTAAHPPSIGQPAGAGGTSPQASPSPVGPASDVPQAVVGEPVAGPASAEGPQLTPPAPPAQPRGRFVDGTYQGRGSCIHGDIQAQVVVRGGRIVEATISSCETRYSCDWLDPILPQVAARQSAFVDYVSGATDSTDAFSAAVTDALLKAQ